MFLGCGIQDYAPYFEPPRPPPPANFSWSNVEKDGKILDYTTSVKAQPCFDCYIYASIALLEMQYQIDHNTIVNLDLSEQEIHNCMKISCFRAGDSGAILNYIGDFGIIGERFAEENEWKACRACDILPRYSFKRWKILIPNHILYKEKKQILINALKDGPIIVGIGDSAHYIEKNGIYECIMGPGRRGSHAAVIIGYENFGELFIIKDSAGGEIRRFKFTGGKECEFAYTASQIVAGTTYRFVDKSEFCYTERDMDADGIGDYEDNCYDIPNTDQKNTDGDILGDACDPCIDNIDANCKEGRE